MLRLGRILHNEYVYSVITKIISLVISLLQSVIIARYLGATLQGISSYITSIVSIGAIIITFGIHQAYPYFRKKYGKESIYRTFISAVMIVYSIYFVIALTVALCFVNTIEIRIAIVLIPLYGYDRVVNYVALIEKPNKRNSWWMIISIVDVLFVALLALTTTRSLGTAVLILVFVETMKSIVFTIMIGVRPCIDKKVFSLLRDMFKMGLFPMIALLMTTLNYKIDILMLRAFPIISVAQIGVYSIGMSFADKIALIPDSLKGILVSRLSKGATEEEVAKVCRIGFWANIIVFFAFIILGDQVISLLYGKEYDGAYSVLIICAMGSIFVSYFNLIAQYNIVNNKQIRNVALLSLSIIINIGLNCLLIPKYELNGAALASGIGYFLSGIIFVIWFSKTNNINMSKMFLIQKNDLKFLMLKKK